MKSEVKFTSVINFPKDFQQEITDCINWEKPINQIITGRSGYMKLEGPVTPAQIQLVKLKGLGHFDAKNQKATPPAQSEYDGGKQKNDQNITELANRLIVNSDGSFEIKEFEKKPFGGQFYSRVETEFNACETLYDPNKRLTTYIPIAKAKYTDIEFNSQPIGVAIIGLPSQNLTFLEEYFIVRIQGDQILVSNRLNPRANPDEIFELLNGFCHQIGDKLRHIHQHFVGIEGHLGNCTVIPENKELLIHDLDYLLPVSDMSPAQKLNYYTRDITSFLCAIITNILFSDLLSFAPHLASYNTSFQEFNFLKSLLLGYSEEIPENLEKQLDDLWKDVLAFYESNLTPLPPKERLLLLHPLVVEQKIILLESLFDFCSQFIEENLGYSREEHQKNLKQLVQNFKS